MSISTLINPSGEVSVQDDLWHIAHSTLSGSTDFKYVFDVYNGNTQLIRTKVFPEPANGRGYFNASQVVRNEIQFNWFTPTASGNVAMALIQPNVSGQVAITYQIRVGEELTGTTTLNLASGNTTAYNYTPSLFNRRQVNTSSFAQKFLTNRPRYATAKIGEKILIPFKGTGTHDIFIETYTYSNVQSTAQTVNSVNITTGYLQMDIGSAAINTATNKNTINSNIKYYDVYLQKSGINTEKFRVYLTCDPRYTTINLYFINQYGMYDTARFGLASRLNMSIEKKEFEKRDFNFNTTGVTYYDSNNVYNESVVNFGSKAQWQYKLTMDYPTDAEYQWLSELMTSPQIFAELEGDFYPVTIKDTNYEYSTYQNNKLKVLEVNIDMNQKRYGFRR
jgi:hypothetical protein